MQDRPFTEYLAVRSLPIAACEITCLVNCPSAEALRSLCSIRFSIVNSVSTSSLELKPEPVTKKRSPRGDNSCSETEHPLDCTVIGCGITWAKADTDRSAVAIAMSQAAPREYGPGVNIRSYKRCCLPPLVDTIFPLSSTGVNAKYQTREIDNGVSDGGRAPMGQKYESLHHRDHDERASPSSP